MLLTIYNLPENTRYADVKSLIVSKCDIKEMILDNLGSWGSFMKVTVGLASEEDAAILVRKINGLFINGTQLHVEDVRKRKQAMEQPYYCTNRTVSYPSHQEEPEYMEQPSKKLRFQDNDTSVNPLATFYQPNYTPYVPSGPPAQNVYTPYEEQQAVQYPTPQRMYQTPNEAQQEPLGFRSESNVSPWAHSQGRNNEPPKRSFAQRDVRWSPARDRSDERSTRPSRWGDRDDSRRESSPRDHKPRDRGQPSTSRHASDRDNFRGSDNRGPQRLNDRYPPNGNRNQKAPVFGKDREFERSSNNPSHGRNRDQRPRRPDPNPQQPWMKPNSGSFNTQNRGDQNQPKGKRYFEQNIEEQPQKRPRLPTLGEVKKPTNKPKRKYTAEEYAKIEQLRSETWRAQTASQIAKDMLQAKNMSEIDHPIFFKELKRLLRERLTGMCHPLMRHDGLYAKYRKKYKEEDDETFMNEVMERTKIAEEVIREKCVLKKTLKGHVKVEKATGDVKYEIPSEESAQAHASDVKVLIESKPLKVEGDFKIPLVPKVKPEPPPAYNTEPKYTKSELSKFKRQKQQTKRVFQNENLMLDTLDTKTAEALEKEVTHLFEKFMEECNDPDMEQVLNQRLSTTVAEDFKRVVKVHIARRILNREEPIVRVFCSPKMLPKSLLSEFLESQGITAMKKSSKHPMLLASCQSYAVHDRLCAAEPMQIKDRIISFKPLQIAGPPVKVTRQKITEQRKMFIDSQIDNTIDNEMKLMNDIKEFQEELEEENVKQETEVNTKPSESDNTNNNATDNIQIEDTVDEVDDYKIVEDTIGNFNENEAFCDFADDDGNMGNGDENTGNTDNIETANGGNVAEDDGDVNDSEEQTQDVHSDADNDCEDLEIGDIDEDDLEDY